MISFFQIEASNSASLFPEKSELECAQFEDRASVPVSQTALLTRPLFAFNKELIFIFFFEVLKKLNGTENAAEKLNFQNRSGKYFKN